MKGKLAPRYIGPFPITAQRGEVAYELQLPEALFGIHPVFHVSQLKKCLRVPEDQIRLEEIELSKDLTYAEHPIKLLDLAEKRTRNRRTRMWKVKWSNHSEEEVTWETENWLKKEYPNLFQET